MGQLRPRAWLIPAIVFVTIVAGSIAAGTAVVTAETTSAETTANSTFVAECTAGPTDVNVGETVTLDASNSDTSFVEFDKEGNGQYTQSDETDFIVNVSYAEPGTYQPRVRDADGNVAQCGTVVVNAPPSASLTWTPDPGVEGQPVAFNASSSVDSDGAVERYHWDWNGDETIDETTTNSTVNHTFFETGFRNVGLTVEDDDGSNSTAAFRDVEIVEANVIARCSAEPQTVVVGQNVTIDASASQNASYLNYEFGDGEVLFETTDFRVTHSYTEPGEYTPVVTVFGPGGKSDTVECPTITVERANEPPTAEFSYDPGPGIAGESMTFDASPSSDPDGTVQTYRWDWDGDEQFELTTDEPVVEHTFDAPGFKNVGLQVQDDANATDIQYQDVSVVRPVVARCSVEPQTVEVGQPVTIDARASGNGSYLAYDFDGDGEYERPEAAEFVAEHSYDEPGEYTPVITVYGARGQSDTVECPTITVKPPNEPPEASFTYDPNPGIAGQSMTFDASNLSDPDGQITSYEWTIDGETYTGQSVEHTFDVAGDYTAELTVTDDSGATATASRDVAVHGTQPTAAFSTSPRQPTAAEATTFYGINSRDPDGQITSYEWTIDGETYDGQTVEHTFDSAGTYTVELTVTDDSGETDTTTQSVEIDPAPTTSDAGTSTQSAAGPSDDSDDSSIPWLPLGAGTLAGLTGLTAWYRFGGSDDPAPGPPPSGQPLQQGDDDTPGGDTTEPGDTDAAATGGGETTDPTEVTMQPAQRFAQAHPAVASAYAVSETGPIHVYRGSVVDGPEDACLYTLAPEHTESEAAVSAFTGAVSRWRGISQNEGIATVYESGESPRPWVAFDDSGDLLADVGSDLSLTEKRQVLMSVFEGLKVGSLYSVTHPGLEPETVTIAGSDTAIQASLFDWGLTRDVDAALDHAPVTPYTAPEQLKGNQSATTDVYRAGALAYWLLTGVEPHARAENLHRAIRTASIEPPSELARVPAELDGVLAKATATNPTERYDSVSELRNQLRRVLD